ncbi:MAG: TrbC/VirB2 family protein [Candidatus Diapherotrites archaeon]|nr:TrbC/VirB2 family protein [Candidatus Diapherotrites archaeon]
MKGKKKYEIEKTFAKTLAVFVLLNLFGIVFAQTNLDAAKAAITDPLNKIVGLLQSIVTIVALIFGILAGLTYMSAGEDITVREKAKGKIIAVIIGLVIVWAAPAVINYLQA